MESDNSDAIAYGNTITDQRDENATEVEILEAALNDAKADNTDLVVGGIVGAAIGAVIATKRATSKPQVDYGSDEEE